MSLSNWSSTNSLTSKGSYLPTTEEAILTASDKAQSDSFSWSVSVSSDGSRVAVGAYGADPSGIATAGKVYIFTRSGTTWTQEAILTTSNKAMNDLFGTFVSMSSDGTRIAIGAYNKTVQGVSSAGAAYIFS